MYKHYESRCTLQCISLCLTVSAIERRLIEENKKLECVYPIPTSALVFHNKY